MVFQKNFKDLISVGASDFGSSVINAGFWLFLAFVLNKSEYGELGFIMSIATVGSAISLVGMRTLVVVYESKQENVFPASFVIILVSSTISALVISLVTNNPVIGVLVIGMTIFEIMLAVFSARQRFRDFSISRLLRAVITVISALIFFNYFGMNGILIGYFLGTTIIFKDLYPFLKNKKITFSILRPKIRFIVETYVIRLSGVLFKWGDKVLIGIVFNFTVLANYHFAMQFLLLLDTIPRAIASFLTPKEAVGEKNKKIKLFSILVSVLIAMISVAIIPYGVHTFVPNYEASIIAMQILSIAVIPLSITGIQEAEFFGKVISRPILIGAVLQAVMYFVSILTLGQQFGLIGMAIGFLISASFRTSFNFFVNKKYITKL